MSTVFEPVVSGNFVAKNGKSNGNGTGTSRKREIKPIGLNASKSRQQTLFAERLKRRTARNVGGHRAPRRRSRFAPPKKIRQCAIISTIR